MMTLKVNHTGANMARFPLSESNVIELKRNVPLKDQIVKTSIAFCNTYGGKIIIGVEDNGQIIGLTDHALEEAMEALEESIFNSC
ncbi:MAG TPA: ATP-binding protein, partial [Gammaproteobacteria bacterium]|nr:ATP-binding protein [Gammaproteobacteria bacterium]